MDERRRRREPTKLGAIISAAGARIAELFFKKQLMRSKSKKLWGTMGNEELSPPRNPKTRKVNGRTSPPVPSENTLKRANSAPERSRTFSSARYRRPIVPESAKQPKHIPVPPVPNLGSRTPRRVPSGESLKSDPFGSTVSLAASLASLRRPRLRVDCSSSATSPYAPPSASRSKLPKIPAIRNMAAPDVYNLVLSPLTCHGFNSDRSRLAVSANTNEAQIYSRSGGDWKLEETLSEHDKLVTSIDWAPTTNRIVTCSQDRNAYVWSQAVDALSGKTIWKPTLVLLRINRAATFVRWSPNEDKFAVASGARAIAICSFDPENNWWVSKQLKKPIRSTVLSVDWHPNNVLLAAGSADMKARVFSAFIKDTDKRPVPTVWGEKLPFNTLCGEYSSSTGGWVHAVGFSPSGDALAFASHDSSITIVYPGEQASFTIKVATLPYVTLVWASEDGLIAAGHDCQPMLFQGSQNGGWRLIGSLDDTSAPKSSGFPAVSARGGVGRLNNEAFNRFKNADSRGTSSPTASSSVPGSPMMSSPGVYGTTGESELLTIHQNTITSVRAYESSGGVVTKVSTTGVDGKLVIWNVSAAAGLAGRMGGMTLR